MLLSMSRLPADFSRDVERGDWFAIDNREPISDKNDFIFAGIVVISVNDMDVNEIVREKPVSGV